MHTLKLRKSVHKSSILALAITAAFGISPAFADDEEVAALTIPKKSVEIGVLNSNRDSAKFGEYTGINKADNYLNLNIDARGGESYGAGNSEGKTTRWSIIGNDLGLTSRSLGVDFADQGRWAVKFIYDELKHNLTDTYQTPYLGSMGGNSFTLPSTITPSTTFNTTTSLTASQLNNMDISSTRKNSGFKAIFNIDSRSNLTFDYNHLDQSGAKLMAFGSFGSTSAAPNANNGIAGERVSILPMPTNSQTDTVNLAWNLASDKGHLSTSYFGSFFKNGYDRVGFGIFSTNTVGVTQYMTTAPDNAFHQLSLSGGYSINPATKLAGSLSYARNTQNQAFVTPDTGMMTAAIPVASLDGVVINTHADLKLTNKTTKDLTLSAAYKYDERDNQTASNFYSAYAIDGSNNNKYIFPNTPLSYKKQLYEVAGDYRIAKGQSFRLSFNREDIDRWCGQYAVSSGIAAGALGYYPTGTNCVVAKSTSDDKVEALYKFKPSETVDLKFGYAYSDRKSDFDPNAITARIGTLGNATGNPLGSTTASPAIKGINSGDYPGFQSFAYANRIQQALKASVSVQASEKVSLGASARVTDDDYSATYGVQKGSSWSANLDATYAYREAGSVYGYVTQQYRQRDFTDYYYSTATYYGTWTNKLKDKDISFGLGVKENGLMGGKLQLLGDFSYSLGRAAYSTISNLLGTSANANSAVACGQAANYSCGDVPEIRSLMTQFKLAGTYQVDKVTKVGVQYIYRRLNASDYYYNGYQYGYTPTGVMPTNQQPGSYNVNLVGVSYIRNF